jgi:hypothetical protein
MRRSILRAAAGVTALICLAGCARFDAAGRSATITATSGSQPVPASESTAAAPTGSPIAAPLPTLDSAEIGLQAAMPGLFGADDLHATVSGDVVSVWSQHGCTDLLGALRAGQWALTMVHQPASTKQRTWVAIMAKGAARALLTLNGGPGGCSGRIVRDRAVSVTASGAATTHGDGRFLSLMCMAQWDDSGSSSGTDTDGTAEPVPSQEYLVGLYTTAGRGFVVLGELPTKPGTYHVAAADIAAAENGDDGGERPGVSIVALPAHTDPLPPLLSSFGVLLYPLDLSTDQTIGDQGMEQLLAKHPDYGGGPKAAETITINASSPLTGRFSATGLANQRQPSAPALDFSAPFGCDR